MLHIFAGASHTQMNAVVENYGNIPLAFTANYGQLDSRVKFSTRSSGTTMFFTQEGTTFLLSTETEASRNHRAGSTPAKGTIPAESGISTDNEPGRSYEYYAIELQFLAANSDPVITGEDRLPWNNNYFIGSNPDNWHTDVPNYSKIRVNNIYKGIDLVYYGGKNTIKYDFVVQPGANPDDIILTYDFGDFRKNDLLKINSDNELEVKTPLGKLIDRKPYSYQTIDGNKIEVDVRYEIVNLSENIYKFSIGKYSRAHHLVIDPELVYSTSIGGSERDESFGIAVDSGGNVYITGFTKSSNFPATSGAYDTTQNGWNADVFVSKLNPSGSSLLYATYLGGNILDRGNDIAVDTDGSVYITGFTNSNDFPATPWAFDASHNGDYDVFVSKLNSSGNDLVYSTFLGDTLIDYGNGIAVDNSGNVYITGYTFLKKFPTTTGAFDEYHNGNYDVFVSKLNHDGSALIYSTFLGGSGRDEGNSIAVDAEGNAYITGFTNSDSFPTTTVAFNDSINGNLDVFVSKLNSTGESLVYSTFIGGKYADYGSDIVVDYDGNAYITGYTLSNNFPMSSGAFNGSYTGLYDVFVSMLNFSGSKLLYSTYLGGSDSDRGKGIAVDTGGNVYVIGYTNSGYFPITAGAFHENHNGGDYDVFVSKLNPSMSDSLLYSTYLGTIYWDEGYAITLDNDGNVYITGKTESNENSNIFVSKLILDSNTGVNNDKNVITGYRLFENYPNPFNLATTITFDIPAAEYVTIYVYNIAGQRIKTLVSDYLPASTQTIVWDGTNDNGLRVSSGLYLFRLQAGGFSAVKKMVLIK